VVDRLNRRHVDVLIAAVVAAGFPTQLGRRPARRE